MTLARILAVGAVLGLLTTSAATAHDYTLGALKIGHPWSRAMPKGAPVGPGFLTVTNTGTTADRLIAANADVSAKVEIHEMAVVDGVMKMRALDKGLEIPAGGTVELKPGGYHIMFIGLKAPFEAGQRFKGTVTFEKAGTVEVDYEIEAMATKMQPPQGHAH